MWMRSVSVTTMRSIAAAAGLLLVAEAAAGPAEDYAAGEKAYQQDDLPTAMMLLERASAAGHAPAQTLLAWIMDGAEENGRAVVLYRKAAAQGYAEGQYGLATMYVKGEGVSRNPAEALRLLRLAAEQGHAKSARLVGEAYLSGDLGLAPDPQEGRRWLEVAAAAGDTSARQRLESLDRAAQGAADAAE